MFYRGVVCRKNMNKKLYVMMSVLCVSYATAEITISGDGTPVLTISGNAAFSLNATSPAVTYYKGDDKEVKKDKKHSKDTWEPRAVAGEAELIFNAAQKLSEEGKCGCEITMDTHRGDSGVNKMYLYFNSKSLGELKLGNVKGSDQGLIRNGQSLLCAGAGGLDGIVSHDIPFVSGLISPLYPVGFSNKATKITYSTPKWYAGNCYVMFAVSYTPDTKHQGHDDKSRGNGKSMVGNDYGIFYKKDNECPSGKHNVGLAMAVGYDFTEKCSIRASFNYIFEKTRALDVRYSIKENYEYEKDFNETEVDIKKGDKNKDNMKGVFITQGTSTRKIKLHNASSWQAAVEFIYGQFAVACGYLNNGKSRLPLSSEYKDKNTTYTVLGEFLTTADSNAGSAWNIGTKYTYEKWTLALVYHNMKRRVTNNQCVRGNAITLGVDYAICNGVRLFTELDYVHAKSCDAVTRRAYVMNCQKSYSIEKQNSFVVAVGAKVVF